MLPVAGKKKAAPLIEEVDEEEEAVEEDVDADYVPIVEQEDGDGPDQEMRGTLSFTDEEMIARQLEVKHCPIKCYHNTCKGCCHWCRTRDWTHINPH